MPRRVIGVEEVKMPDIEQTAGELYEAYCAAVGGKAFNGDALPNWADFRADDSKRKQSDAWVTTATKAWEICK